MTDTAPIQASAKRKRQTALIIVVMSFTVAISATLIWLSEDTNKLTSTLVSENQKNKSTSTTSNPGQNLETPAQQIDPAELRMARTEQMLSQVGESTKEVSKSVVDTSQRLKMLEELFKEKSMPPVAVPQFQANNEMSQNRVGPNLQSKSPPPIQPEPTAASQGSPATPLNELANQAQAPKRLIYMDRIESDTRQSPNPVKDQGFAVAGRSSTGVDGSNPTKTELSEIEAKVDSVKAENYVPAASFVKAVLLNGLDAPTGGQAQANPQPIILRLTDLAFLPNRFRGAIKECFVLASGYGDIASERAFMRTDTLSCVNTSGYPIEVKISGYISGEDGKTGMRGRMVTKQGQVLANALLTGSVSALGKILSMTSSTVTEGPGNVLGLPSTSTTITPGKAAQNVLGQGLTSAMDKISNYYLKLADQLFPVVEIDAGRQVEVIFTKGFNFGVSNKEEMK